MKKTLTKQYVLDNRGCYKEYEALALSFMQNDSFTVEDIINSEIPLNDKYWFVIKKCDLTLGQKQQIALEVAEIVLPIYETKYPSDKRVRECLETTKLFLAGHVSLEELVSKRSAAYAAYDAAYADAAYAAYAAAYAAYDAAYADAYADAAYAAYAAAYAAYDAAYDAAYAAAYATYAAAYAAAYGQKLQEYLTNFVKETANA